MKKYLKIIVLLLLLANLMISCKDDEAPSKSEEKTQITKVNSPNINYNISILLDLSDRIDPQKYSNTAMEFYQRDLGYINSISQAFTDHIRNKKVRLINDKIEVYFNPEPQNQEINNISKKLKFEINKNNASKSGISLVNTTYNHETAKIYDLAIKDNNYIGADIWKFFENNVNDYCIDPNRRNILVILTDGYIFYKDTKIKEENATSYLLPEMIRSNGLNKANWKEKMKQQHFGFIKANENLSNLEILVLGVNPDKKNPYEGKVIKEYWSNWFTGMKVKRFEIKETGLPSNMDKVIKDFIANPV